MGDEDIMSKKKRRILIIAISVVALFGVLMALNIYIDREKRVYKECSVEAGTPVSASDFVRFKKDKKSAAFQYGTSAYDVSVPGEYNVTIQLGKKTYDSKLIVTDTITPVLSAAPKTAMYGQVIPAEDFTR